MWLGAGIWYAKRDGVVAGSFVKYLSILFLSLSVIYIFCYMLYIYLIIYLFNL